MNVPSSAELLPDGLNTSAMEECRQRNELDPASRRTGRSFGGTVRANVLTEVTHMAARFAGSTASSARFQTPIDP